MGSASLCETSRPYLRTKILTPVATTITTISAIMLRRPIGTPCSTTWGLFGISEIDNDGDAGSTTTAFDNYANSSSTMMRFRLDNYAETPTNRSVGMVMSQRCDANASCAGDG